MEDTTTQKAVSHTDKRIYARLSNLLLASMLGYGVTAGALVAGALAASVLPAQTPLTQPSLVMTAGQSTTAVEAVQIPPLQSMAQPMPPMPDQAYNSKFHEGSVALDSDTSFAGIDPFITGPVPQ